MIIVAFNELNRVGEILNIQYDLFKNITKIVDSSRGIFYVCVIFLNPQFRYMAKLARLDLIDCKNKSFKGEAYKKVYRNELR